MHPRHRLITTLASTCLFASIAFPADAPPSTAAGGSAADGNAHLSALLVNDARDALRDTSLSPANSAKSAAILLQFAARLDPSDLHTLRLLVQASGAAGIADVEKETLRTLIAADPADLVSQVRYIDLLAAGSQALEERSRIYQNALDQPTLDAQIRSEMAVRLARIAEERGDRDTARRLLTQSLQLNNLNISALRGMVRLAAAEPPSLTSAPRHLDALAALVAANPLQPDAWLEAARICEAGTLHDRAADLLKTAIEQLQIDGLSNGDLYLELALEQAIGGRFADAAANAEALAKLPDAPLTALLVAELLTQDNSRGSGAGAAAAQITSGRLVPEIRKRLATLLKNAADSPSALADAAGIELTIMPAPSPDTSSWIDAYAKLVPPDDATLARLKGWLLFRQGQLDTARTTFEKIATADPLAQVGLARVLLAQDKKADAADQLRDLWATHPTGLLALQIAQTARLNDITLPDTSWSRQLRDVAARFTPSVALMHREPRDVVLMTLNFRKPAVGFGEPVMLTVRLSNTTDRALPVGPDGVIKPSVGFAAALSNGPPSTVAPPALGIFAVENIQRVYRVAAHQSIEATVRIDQGRLAELLSTNPSQTMVVNVTAVTAPRILSATDYTIGLGGEVVAAGDFQRAGAPISTPADFQKFLDDLQNQSGEKRLSKIAAAGALLTTLKSPPPAPAAPPPTRALPADARQRLIASLASLATSLDPAIKAALLHSLPPGPIDPALDPTLDRLSQDKDPLVRLLWAKRQIALIRTSPAADPAAKTARTTLESAATTEKDPSVKEWITAALPPLPASTLPPTPPAPTP